MKKINKMHLKATVASAAFGLALLASNGAYAFDTVNWDWNKTVTEDVMKDVKVKIDNKPTGMVEVEKIQAQIGDVTANSTVSQVSNNVPEYAQHNMDGNGGDGHPSDSGYGNSSYGNGGYGNGGYGNNHTHPEVAINDAVDLPIVVSAATAVGNNQNIESSVATELHDGQFLIGGFAEKDHGNSDGGYGDGNHDGGQGNGGYGMDSYGSGNYGNGNHGNGGYGNGNHNHGGQQTGYEDIFPDTGNTNTDIAGALTIAGALGLITPANVTATSSVSDITNASVDSNATAIANNMNVNVDATSQDDAMMLADLTQFSYANVSADSTVNCVTANNYTGYGDAGMGALASTQKPLVSSVATAIGNNTAIKVSSPGL